MGYPTIAKFDVNFIERTKENIEAATDGLPNTFTNLINSMIGLIFIPNEFYKSGKQKFKIDFLNQPISDFAELTAIFSGTENLVDESGTMFSQAKFMYMAGGSNKTINDTSVGNLLRLFRNGIAHQNVTPTAEGDRWKGIIVKNFNDKKVCNFETYLTQRNLRLFGLFIADQYLANII